MPTPYIPGFYAGIADGSRRSALRVLPLVFELAPHGSIIDVGCGVGSWLNAARQLGVHDVTGVDGDYVQRDQLEIPAERFIPTDLSGLTHRRLAERLPSGAGRFDLALSLEVAEHLPPHAAAGFIDLLCALAPVVLFSAAVPFQGGTNHLNERFPSFWATHFARHGHLAVDAVRQRVWDDANVEWWYRQNTLLFAAPAALEAHPVLASWRRRTRDSALDLVHPAHYQRVVDWGSERWRRVHAKPS
jgi:cyclopropane fatty-acyl-phospholipid synthase-like methyltransferase